MHSDRDMFAASVAAGLLASEDLARAICDPDTGAIDDDKVDWVARLSLAVADRLCVRMHTTAQPDRHGG